MIDVLKPIYNACDPIKPATATTYWNCGEGRGSSQLTQRFWSHLDGAEDYLCFLFSGHVGCGKSSELEQVRHDLANPQDNDARYFPVLIKAADYVDLRDASPIEILLAIITGLAAALRGLHIELKDNYFTKRLEQMKHLLLSDVEISAGKVPVLGGEVEIQRLKTEPKAREQVRKALEPQVSTMLAEMNLLFEEARQAIRKEQPPAGQLPFKDFVLLVDDLEKIVRIEGHGEGLPSMRELFLERYTQLTGLRAHIIYTVPLDLVRSTDGPKLDLFYGPLFVLPMVKIVVRASNAPFEPGLQCLRALLRKRLDGHKVADIFTDDALDFLLRYSGGNIRHLMMLVQEACSYAKAVPIPLPAAHLAIQPFVRSYSASITEPQWPKLAQLAASIDQQIVNGDPDYPVLLGNLSILEYLNGIDEDNPFAHAEPWYAVHPVVRELRKFKTAATALATSS
jgi:hypothetical protein